jgi:hypothetical protein
MKPGVRTAQRTIAEMRAAYEEPIEPCPISVSSNDATPPAANTIMTDVHAPARALVLTLPGAWRLDTAYVARERAKGSELMVWRSVGRTLFVEAKPNGAVGPSYMPDTLPLTRATATCEVAAGSAGVIWRRYAVYPTAATGQAPRVVYSGLGSVISVDSLRFQVWAWALTAAARDSLVAQVSRAVLAARRADTARAPS